jgi:thiosulfate/3-mercaptopyruvate sulfurtransferase
MGDSLPRLVAPEWLAPRLHWEDLVVLDATVELHFPEEGPYTAASERAGYLDQHVPGAVFADVLGDLSDPDGAHLFTLPSPERFAAAAGALGIGPGRRVVVYDRGAGAWATRLWWLLRVFGFDDVAVLDGGLPAWTAGKHPVETGEVPPRPTTFPVGLRRDLVADADDVAKLVGDETACLVFTLDEATFLGEGPLRYRRPGRIPGSRLVPSAQFVDPGTGRYLPVDQLRDRLAAGGVLTASRPVSYCGGGISATVVAFAAALAGRDDVAVYDGSLTEWAADPSRPLVTGHGRSDGADAVDGQSSGGESDD